MDALLAHSGHLESVRRAHLRHFARLGGLMWEPRLVECFADPRAHHGTRAGGWETCCSTLRSLRSSRCGGDLAPRASACCAFGNASRSFLRIPALREAWVQVRLPTGTLLRLEQDGWLRPFDMPTVLWPAGFLLAQWAAGGACAAGLRVLELGAGVGAPSIACALSGARVLATDVAPTSLALIEANAGLNGVAAAALRTARFDWHSDADLERVAAGGPYDLVMGAALQFERAPPRPRPRTSCKAHSSSNAWAPDRRMDRPLLARASRTRDRAWQPCGARSHHGGAAARGGGGGGTCGLYGGRTRRRRGARHGARSRGRRVQRL